MKLELYHMEHCPFCRRVFAAIDQAGRTDIIYKDIIKDPQARQTLKEVGGMEQVPCLFIDGQPMYESLDIIAWLDAHPQE